MKYRQLGRSDLRVSEISLGSWLTYSGGVDRREAESCVRKAFEVGINFFDTANVYGRGAAETFLGEVLQSVDRSSYILATKLEWSADQIRRSFQTPGEQFVSSQPQYSMLWRKPEKEIFPLCAEHGIGQIVWSPLAQGVLTGKYRPGKAVPKDSRAASPSMGGFIDRFLDDEVLTCVEGLKAIAKAAGCSLAQMALAWVLRDPRYVASAIIGATRPQQVEENAAASDLKLTAETLKAIDEVLAPAIAHVGGI